MLARFPFEYARHNFYRAAKAGLKAELVWPREGTPSVRAVHAGDLARELLPLAQRGLEEAGVEHDDFGPLLQLFERRLDAGITGAIWQDRVVSKLKSKGDEEKAFRGMLERYLDHAASGKAVGGVAFALVFLRGWQLGCVPQHTSAMPGA